MIRRIEETSICIIANQFNLIDSWRNVLMGCASSHSRIWSGVKITWKQIGVDSRGAYWPQRGFHRTMRTLARAVLDAARKTDPIHSKVSIGHKPTRLRVVGEYFPKAVRRRYYSAIANLQYYPSLVQIYPEPGSHDGLAPQVDVVAVHGLGANPERTWVGNINQSIGNGNPSAVKWLEDHQMLPSIIPRARISTFNYESNWLREGPIQKLPSLAEQLLSLLSNSRRSSHARSLPLVFVGHSFGGLVVEQALVAASIPGSPFAHLAASTSGMLFLGTPHRGSRMADYAVTLARAARTFGFAASDSLLKDITAYSEVLQALLGNFSSIARAHQYQIVCCFEQLPSNLLRGTWLKTSFQDLVVDEHSACIDGYQRIAIAADHSGLNKFAGPKDGNFQLVSNAISDLVFKSIKVAASYEQQTIPEATESKQVSQSILGWLAPINPDIGLSRAIEARQAGTGDWFLVHKSFVEWHSGESPSIFWLSGKPGSGKTILLSSAVEHVKDIVASEPGAAVAHFYCSYRNIKSCDPRNVFGSYIAQLCQVKQEFWSQVELLYHQTSEDIETHGDLPTSQLESILRDIIRSCSCVYLFLNDPGESREGLTIIGILEKLVRDCPNLKLFVASVPDHDIFEAIEKFPGKLYLSLTPNLIEPDIRHYIQTKLESLPKLRLLDNDLKAFIQDRLISDANGM